MPEEGNAAEENAEDTSAPEEAVPEAESAPEEAPAEEAAPAAEEAPAEPAPAAEAPAIDGGNGTIGIVLKEIAFRTGPSFNKAVISPLKPGAKLTVIGSEQGEKGLWYQCEYQGKTGYVKATGIRLE